MFDPFAILGLPSRYDLDVKVLEKAYFDAQRKTHPDQFAGASIAEKQKASQQSAALNQAYALLKNPLSRAEALLYQGEEAAQPADPAFLEQMMIWQEQSQAGTLSEKDMEALKDRLLQDLTKAFEEKDFSHAKKIVGKLKYFKNHLFCHPRA